MSRLGAFLFIAQTSLGIASSKCSSYCRCYDPYPVCQGQNTPCLDECTTTPVTPVTTTTAAASGTICPDSYCRCYDPVPVCQGTNILCGSTCVTTTVAPNTTTAAPTTTTTTAAPTTTTTTAAPTTTTTTAAATTTTTSKSVTTAPSVSTTTTTTTTTAAPTTTTSAGTTTTTVNPDVSYGKCASGKFTEDFSSGKLDSGKWKIFKKKWGDGNNGLVPELISFVNDSVNGSAPRPVLSLGIIGDITPPGTTIRGVTKSKTAVKDSTGKYTNYPYTNAAPTRVGSGICTSMEFGSGVFEVLMKIPVSQQAVGYAPSLWTFHYEEHYPARGSGKTSSNPKDLLYRPQSAMSDGEGGWYSTVNSEIDMPEIGVSGNFKSALYTSYISENETKSFKMPMPADASFADNKYHKWKMVWKTELRATTCSSFAVDVTSGHYYCTQVGHADQAFPAKKMADNTYKIHAGKSLEFSVDGIVLDTKPSQLPITSSTTPITAVAAKVCIAAWAPIWSGPAPFALSDLKVAEVNIEPSHDEGDICWQNESYPNDGLLTP